MSPVRQDAHKCDIRMLTVHAVGSLERNITSMTEVLPTFSSTRGNARDSLCPEELSCSKMCQRMLLVFPSTPPAAQPLSDALLILSRASTSDLRQSSGRQTHRVLQGQPCSAKTMVCVSCAEVMRWMFQLVLMTCGSRCSFLTDFP